MERGNAVVTGIIALAVISIIVIIIATGKEANINKYQGEFEDCVITNIKYDRPEYVDNCKKILDLDSEEKV